MIVRFSVKNYLSFGDEVIFSAVASAERQHPEHLVRLKNLRFSVLPIAMVLGANGAGKSNFYHALDFLRGMVLHPPKTPEDRIAAEVFRLNEQTEGTPVSLRIEMLVAEEVYRLSILVTSHRVLEERLERVKVTSEQLIYRLWFDGEDRKSDLSYFARAASSLKPEEIQFLDFKVREKWDNQLFLSAMRGQRYPELEAVIGWFRDQLRLMTPSTIFKELQINLRSVQGLHDYCNEAVRRADTGIDAIALEAVPVESVPLPPQIREQVDGMKDDQVVVVRTDAGHRFSFGRENGQLRANRLVTEHRTKSGKMVRFDMADESQGTQRFVDLLPAFYELAQAQSPKVFVIDELDRSLHTELTRNLVQTFLQATVAGGRGQLIFTAHDVMLLDQEIFRRDEIWFVDKADDGQTGLFSLGDFEGIRYDKDIRRSYLLGRFGGKPRILALPRNAPPKPAESESALRA